MPTRLPLALLLLVAVAGAAALAGRRGLVAADAGAVTKAPARPGEAPLATLEATGADGLVEPTLRGRAVYRPAQDVGTGVRVRVLGVSGAPMPCLCAEARWPVAGSERGEEAHGTTGEDGWVELATVPRDGSARVGVRRESQCSCRCAMAHVVTGPELTIRLDHGLPATLHVVDAESGVGVEEVSARWGDGAARAAFLRPGRLERIHVSIGTHPPGYVAWDEASWVEGIGLWTQALTAVYPLRREAEVSVTVCDHAGHLEVEAHLDRITVASREAMDPRATVLGPGRFRLRGVPFLRGEPLTVHATAPYLLRPLAQTLPLPNHPADRTEMEIVLPAPGSQRPEEDSGGFGRRGPCRRALAPESPGCGALDLHVLRHDGSPASHASVFVGRRQLTLDEDGRVSVNDLPLGTCCVRTSTIGLLPMEHGLELVKGETVQLELQESAGGAIDLRVTDVHGKPLPFATLSVKMPSGSLWVDEQDGVQRVDPFTDRLGRRRIQRVETGRVEVRARWGSRVGTTAVEVEEGRAHDVTLVVR